jgi:hypothetical protein
MIPVRPPIEDEISRRGIRLRGRGPERCGPCPVCGGADRFSINIRRQLWNCRGCQTGGDVIDLVRHIDRCDFRTAVHTLGIAERPSCVRSAPTEPPTPRPAQNDNGKRALALWWASRPIAGTLAETYLQSRGLEHDDTDGEVLRFHPQCPFGGVSHPCMVALFRAIKDNEPRAIHRTALTPDGRKIDRMALGPVGDAAIKLSADEDVTYGLHVAEGIETALAAMSLGFSPAWALGHAGGIAKFPVLAGIDALTIIVDHDCPDSNGRKAGHAAARECARRWMEAGRDVYNIVPHLMGADMADVLADDEVHRHDA